MAIPSILLVDDQREIVRLLYSSLQTLGHELDIIDAPSGEEALLEASRRKIDLLIADYLLPGISGVELMRKVQARNPDLKVIFISGMQERKARNEMLSAGAVATFEKPISIPDFLDTVERCLGLVKTILPLEPGKSAEEHRQSLSEMLAGFRRQAGAEAISLINDRGRVLVRAGDLYDSSMEVPLLAPLMSIFSAGLKVSRVMHQDRLDHYHVFRSAQLDLLLIPVDSSHAMLFAGKDLAGEERILQIVQGMFALRADVERILQWLGVTPTPGPTEAAVPEPEPLSLEPQEPEPEVDLDALFAAASKGPAVTDLDAFWNDAVEKTGNLPTNPDVISFEEARKLGLTPGRTMPVKLTGSLKDTGRLKPPP